MKRRSFLAGAGLAAWPARPEAPRRQIMIPELLELLTAYEYVPESDGWRKLHIATAAQWDSKRADIVQRTLDIMGDFPRANPPLNARTLDRRETPRYTRVKVNYDAADGDRIPAWLLVPHGAGTSGRRLPAVVAAHQTEADGKDSVVGLAGPPYVHYGHDLAQRGFVVLAPDSITAGERILPGSKPFVTAVFDRAHPAWSAMGKMCADHRRGVDYLASLDYVDPRRIGAIGHSLGGYNTFFLAAFDERVRAAVSSCGFSPLGRSSKPFAFARNRWFVHFPRLARYLRSGIVPFDFHEVLALVAPRPFFNYSASQDPIFPDADTIRIGAAQVREVYAVLGAAGRFEFVMGDGPHGFPEPVRQQAYQWLETALRTGV